MTHFPDGGTEFSRRPSGLYVVEDDTARKVQAYNKRRVASCHVIWGSGAQVVGLCPAYDDFLVWLDVNVSPAFVVPSTNEARTFFTTEVLPRIEACFERRIAQMKKERERRTTWLLDMAAHVVDGEEDPGDMGLDLPEDLIAGVDRLVQKLAEFAERFDAQLDRVR